MQNQIDLHQLKRSADYAAGISRQALAEAQKVNQENAALKQQIQHLVTNAEQLKAALSQVQIQRGGDPMIQRIENVPGRRIPFDFTVDIPIGPNITSVQQGTIQIDQSGPFVAVRRYATFISAYAFQRTDPVTNAVQTFNGRSFGRFRPIHSAWDLNDGQPSSTVTQIVAFPGDGSPHIVSPANASPFRTMQGDYRIKVTNQGSAIPRSNLELPSTFWTESINEPFDLGALDFFERGEVITFDVLPTHANNQAFGNVFGFGAPNPSFPFLNSQWDGIEGISDPNDADADDTDPIVRAPSGILTIGFHGYRIWQQPGAGNS